jgi:uncharacterized membrane protein YphA (DoxX/SURF4 family)
MTTPPNNSPELADHDLADHDQHDQHDHDPHALAGRPLARALAEAARVSGRIAPSLLRLSLALVFVWFGAMKVTGTSPVFGLVAATLPWFDPYVVVPVIGLVEIVLGLGLLIPVARPVVLAGLVAHLTGTFLTFLVAPRWMFQSGDPLLLTADGEFVLKNLVLIGAALALLAISRPPTGRHQA